MRNPSLTLVLTCLTLAPLGHLAADCDYDQQYSHNGLCCAFCPPGHFVQKHCSKTHQTTCAPCSSGTYSQVTDNLDSCRKCKTCQQVTSRECSTTLDAHCSCHEGFLCNSPECGSCLKKPMCPRGHGLNRTGVYLYDFRCEPCLDGMYSDIVGGVCKALTRCDQLGLKTIFPGNKTHNSECSIPGPTRESDRASTREPDRVSPKEPDRASPREPDRASPREPDRASPREPERASVKTEVILVLILLLCTFTSIAVLVMAHMTKQKKQTNYMKACTSTAVDLPDETLAFQLSKEEKGDRPIQEIDIKSSLTCQMTE